MSVFITDPDALDRIVEFECGSDAHCKEWFKRLQFEGHGDSFANFLRLFLSLTEEERNDIFPYLRMPSGNTAIYGIYGVARYFVRRKDGEIDFSRSHAPSRAKEAENFGFSVQ